MQRIFKKTTASERARERGKSWDVVDSKPADGAPSRKSRPYKSLSSEEMDHARTDNPSSNEGEQKKATNETSHTSTSPQRTPPRTRKHTKKEKVKRIYMSDASTQTTNDVSTQTDEDTPTRKARLVDVVNVQTNNASTGMDADIFDKIQSLRIEVQEAFSGKGIKRSPDNIFTDLDDLEIEIAKIRYKALSIKESIEWLEREKQSVMRPIHPLRSQTDGELDEIPTREIKQAFLPVGASPPNRASHVKIKDKRAFSVPVVLTKAVREKSETSALRCGPDQTKKGMQISESSVFSKPISSKLSNVRRHSKSLGDLPEMQLAFSSQHLIQSHKSE